MWQAIKLYVKKKGRTQKNNKQPKSIDKEATHHESSEREQGT